MKPAITSTNTPTSTTPGWFGHPVMSLLVAATWLLLRESAGPADLLWAAVFGLVIPRLIHRFLGPAVRPRAWWVALRLTGVVLYDIVMSNLTVARIVLDPVSSPQPAWVPIKLDTTHPTAIVLFATIITTTPGTVSCVIDEQRGEILVHALDCTDVAGAAEQMKERYERPLMEIFG
jgi:multicomponent K+:H+ antiporter subunit E